MTVERVGVVVIGRNEGPRLQNCLDTLPRGVRSVVYVDSGSTDDSIEQARRRAVAVVALDLSTPFTAARARNTGLDALLELDPSLSFVQFVDGDCELVEGWLEAGARALVAEPRIAAICGRVRERDRDRTIYNRLCDIEWSAPPGEARQCGGNAMMRVSALREAGGFRSGLIAGEEPELCLRLRQRGWRIYRADHDMALHDANMTRFAQWWRRALRAGWAYAERAALHGRGPEHHAVRENASIFLWGAVVPVAALGAALPTHGLSLVLLLAYPVLFARVRAGGLRDGLSARDASLNAAFTVLAKLPQVLGQLQYVVLRSIGKRRRLVDWRDPGARQGGADSEPPGAAGEIGQEPGWRPRPGTHR